MGFYGNITNTSRTQFQFDKTYPNRYAMDLNASLDGIYVGRYVLIEYDKQMGADWAILAYMKTEISPEGIPITRFYTSNRLDAATEITFRNDLVGRYIRVPGVKEEPGGTVIIYNYDNVNEKADYIYKIEGHDLESNSLIIKHISALENNPYNENYTIDMGEYGPSRGYDSTVWQKVYVDSQERYVMIAELNTVVPTFDVSPDAPTLSPIVPHFDVDSTNVYYKVHWQPSWGLRIRSASPSVILTRNIGANKNENINLTSQLVNKLPSDEEVAWSRTVYDTSTGETHTYYFDFAKDPETWGLTGNWKESQAPAENHFMPAAIYYNKAGFNPAVISYSDEEIKDRIALESTGLSGNEYNVHGVAGLRKAQVDTQELSIMLPSLGNSIAHMWDIIYGNEEINGSSNRNMFIDWEDGTLIPQLKGLRLVTTQKNGYGYEKANVATLAGAINSVHDLMGMIIQQKDNITAEEAPIENWVSNYIYYLSNEGKFYRKAPTYTYAEVETFDPASYEQYSEVSIDEINWNFPHGNYYLDYVNSNPKDDNGIPYPNYILEKDVYYADRQYYKTVRPTGAGKPGTTFMGSFKEHEYFIYKDIQMPTIDGVPIQTGTYQISLDKVYDPKTQYKTISYESLGDNMRFWIPGEFYTASFEVDNEPTPTKFEEGVLFIQENNKYYRPNSYDASGATTYYAASSFETASEFEADKQYFTVAIEKYPDQTIYIKRTRYEEDPTVTELTFYSREYYYKDANNLYYLASTYDSSLVYYKKIVTLEKVQADIAASISAKDIIEVNVMNFEPNQGYCYHRPQGQGGANGYEDFIILNPSLLKSYRENLVKIAVSDIQDIYQPYLFYSQINDPEDPKNGSYIIDVRPDPFDDVIYYEKETMEYLDAIDSTEIVKYQPGKYYYKVNDEYVLDLAENHTPGRIYYNKNSLYVMSDSEGRFSPGVEWNLYVDKPESVKLGERTETWALTELKEFARSYNTIHGLILKLNQVLDLDNPTTRNLNTVKGALNSIKDVIGAFHDVKPQQIMVTDKYGRMTTTYLTGDEWIKPTYDEGRNIIITHENTGELNGKTIEVNAPETATIPFGGTFTSPNFTIDIDNSGHVDKYTTSNNEITLPHLEYTVEGEGNLVIDMEMSEGSGETTVTFTETRENVGNLLLADYENPENKDNITTVKDSDSINTAFKKINNVLSAISGDEWIVPTAENGNISFAHSNTGELNGKSIEIFAPASEVITFGGKFTSPNLTINIDEAGHVDSFTTTNNEITLPHLAYEEIGSGNIITDMSMTEGQGSTEIKFTETRNNVGTLELTDYAEPTENVTGIVATDTINGAFRKIDEVLGSYDETVTADTNNYISEVKQTNGKLSASTRPTTDITSLGTVTVGTWKASTVDVEHGGTGKNIFTAGEVLLGAGTSPIETRGILDNTSAAEMSVENDARLITANTLKNFSGSQNIVKVGTVTTGTWNGEKIENAYIADNAISTSNIEDGKVTNEKLASGITADKITEGTLSADRIAEGALNGTKIAEGSIEIKHLAEGFEFESAHTALKNVSEVLLDLYDATVEIEDLQLKNTDSIRIALTKLEKRIKAIEDVINPPVEG